MNYSPNMQQTSEEDPIEEQRQELQRLIREKQRLQEEIDLMKKQKEEYEKHKDFYDKLILFNQKLEQLKEIKLNFCQANYTLQTANAKLKLDIQKVEDAVKQKDKQEKHIKEMIEEIKQIKSQQKDI